MEESITRPREVCQMLISGKPFKSRNINFDPFGNPLEQFGSLQSSLGFTGEMTDPNGSLYLRARYATPPLGIFLTRDPFEGVMSRVMSRNGYSYVEANPVNYTDPSGKFIFGGIFGAIAGGVIGAIGAKIMFQMALDNKCGCRLWQWAQHENVNDLMVRAAAMGAVLGGIMGAFPFAAGYIGAASAALVLVYPFSTV